jgi:hypothetical protein
MVIYAHTADKGRNKKGVNSNKEVEVEMAELAGKAQCAGLICFSRKEKVIMGTTQPSKIRQRNHDRC